MPVRSGPGTGERLGGAGTLVDGPVVVESACDPATVAAVSGADRPGAERAEAHPDRAQITITARHLWSEELMAETITHRRTGGPTDRACCFPLLRHREIHSSRCRTGGIDGQ